MSFRKHLAVAALIGCGGPFIFADTIQLKDASAITGKILAEKSDSLVVDVGYTALVIPRTAITSVSKAVAATAAASATAPTAAGQFYAATTKTSAARDVSSLVKQIGEAVVQVKTPGGLGSGFFINDDGFLITNFHVTEGETQISVEVFQQKNGELERNVYKQVMIVSLNKFGDLALLKVADKDAPKFAHVSLGDSDTRSEEHTSELQSPMYLV